LEAVAQASVNADVGPLTEEESVEVQTAQVTRAGTSPQLNSEAFRTAVMELAEQLDPGQPVDSVDPAQRTVAVGVDHSLGLAVAQITAWQPLSLERFRVMGRNVANRMALDRSEA